MMQNSQHSQHGLLLQLHQCQRIHMDIYTQGRVILIANLFVDGVLKTESHESQLCD